MNCVKSLELERSALPRLKVLVVDGGSQDGSAERLTEFAASPALRSWVSVLPLAINGGFGWANSQAILRLLRGHPAPAFVHLLNPDAHIEQGAVVALLHDLLRHPHAAVSGSQLIETDGSKSSGAFRFPTIRDELVRGARTGLIDRWLAIRPITLPLAQSRCDVDWVTGASMMIRAAALHDVGLFDDAFFLYYEETELMWRLRLKGWTVSHEPASRVHHVGGASTGVHDRIDGSDLGPRRPAYWYRSRRLYFVRKHGLAAASLALLAWLSGHLLWRLRKLLGLAPQARLNAHELLDQLRYGFPRPSDLRGGPIAWNSPLDVPPAWMGTSDA